MAKGKLVLNINPLAMEKITEPEVETATKLLKKEHSCLKIEKSTLKNYFDKFGKRIELRYEEEPSGHMTLNFIAFDAAGKEIFTEKLKKHKVDCLIHDNVGFGSFYFNDKGISIHKLIFTDPGNAAKDWYLIPVEFDAQRPEYVAYDLTDEASLITYRLNPCPPCAK